MSMATNIDDSSQWGTVVADLTLIHSYIEYATYVGYMGAIYMIEGWWGQVVMEAYGGVVDTLDGPAWLVLTVLVLVVSVNIGSDHWVLMPGSSGIGSVVGGAVVDSVAMLLVVELLTAVWLAGDAC
ncbi:hypothetical protein J3A83DRAFT_4192490 [Scleroderma citrinum]